MTKTATKTKPNQKKISPIHFVKMTGTGNDFLIIDARDKGFPKFDRALFSRSLCRRTLSIGADGIVFLEKTKIPQVAFKWDFYNADGSAAEMCGNAARCAARYAVDKNIADRSLSIETEAGVVHARVSASGFVEVEMTPPQILVHDLEIPLGEHLTVKVVHVNTGVPHVVKENDDWNKDYLDEMGRYLRNHEMFKKTGGVNVTFYEKVGESVIHAATFERGVEAVTMACGTGAVAAAVAATLGGAKSPIEVQVPGGVLNVKLDKDYAKAFLVGEARIICEGEIKPEALL